jgi:hypothetical protein
MRAARVTTAAGRRFISLAAVAVVTAGSFTAVAAAAPGAHHAPSLHALTATAHHANQVRAVNAFGLPGTVHYAIDRPACGEPPTPNGIRCFAVKRVDVPVGTRGAYRYIAPARAGGPNGGYAPNDLANIYGFNPHLPRANQTVAIVDWYKDPNVRSDLNHFDQQYGIPTETASSFRVVNQFGNASPLPKSDTNSAVEITLDVQSVRAVCRTCKILLIEAKGPFDPDLATAQNTAARMGATEISDSYGEPERKLAPKIRAAYNHPGVVISVSTGDHGWFGWDFANSSPNAQQAPSFPSTAPTVVSVGGTNVTQKANGTRRRELVWNENGRDDQRGLVDGALGATGGGCSRLYAAKPWQSHYANYGKAGCKGKRLAADVSAIADPQTGFDIYDTFGQGGWLTVGGTSLSAPVTAALFALAGGAKGAAYPSSSLYVNAQVHKASVYDVFARPGFGSLASGSGFCGGVPAKQCGNFVFNNFTARTHNPNALGAGLIDCSFSHNPNNNHNATSTSRECNTFPGYDGPTGLGAPNSLRLYTATNPTVAVIAPATVKAHQAAHFRARAHEIVPRTHVTGYSWAWGDGTSTSSSSNRASHRYPHAGKFTVVLRVTDSRFQVTIKRVKVTVKRG